MQTLQCFAGSLQEQAGPKLSNIRATLQDLPKRFLSGRDDGEDYLLGNVSGEFNYHFTFKLEGGGFFQTGVLVASAENAPGGLPVPLRCKWRRRIGDMPVEIPSVTSNMYQISADDVGTDICVEVSPADLDDGHVGTALGEIGPFELDPSTRRSLDNALGAGGNRFNVTQSTSPGDRSSLRTDMQVVVSADTVKVVMAEGKNRESVAEYSPDFPKVIIHPLDTLKFQLIMSENRTLHLQAQSRTQRDLIALTVRCFHARKYLPTAGILQELFPVHAMGPGSGAPAPPNGGGDSHLDECILLERLTKELNRAMQSKDMSEKVLRNTHHEKKQLQAQLEETIRGFTEVITGCQDQLSQGPSSTSSGSVERLQEQFRDISNQNKTLEGQLIAQRKQFDDARRAKKVASQRGGPGPTSSTPEVMQLREKRDMLRAKTQELSSTSGQQRDQADQVHALELKRLRQDVEALHNEKENLRSRLQEADRNRQELQENFLYVKNQLDKVQMKQAQTTAGNTPEEKEVKRLTESIDAVAEERSRLSMRMEGVQRELEKEKSYHESSVERLMAANTKLMEEKDRAEKEVQRMSQLYSESVQNVQPGEHDRLSITRENSGDTLVDTVSAAANQEEVNKLRSEVAQVDEQLKKKEQENESLKSRIRKLAVA